MFVDRFENDINTVPQNFLLEPNDYFCSTYPVAMAACLVDISHNVTSKVRLMNPFDFEVQLKQNTVIGTAEEVTKEPVIFLSSEDNQERNNFDSMRQIKFLDRNPVRVPQKGTIRKLLDESQTDGRESIDIPPHLQELYQQAVDGRNEEEEKAVASLLNEYSDAFSKDENDLGYTNLVEFSIDTGNARPIKQLPRRVPLAFADAEKALINNMEKQGIIQKSSSPWSSPLVLVMKKNGKIRPCVDYRRLNAITVKDAFPLPRIQDCLDTVRCSTLFSTFDLTSGFHQIPVKPADTPKTAFVTKYGLYEFLTMPFGVCNGPQTCQRLMELVLSGLQWQICLIYLDDIIVFSENFEDHLKRLDLVLSRISKAGLKLKPEKCQLLKREVTFLGHLVSEKGIQPNPDNIAKILSWPTPKSVTEIRQFLGMGSYYRRFIKDFSLLVKPLTELTKKNKEFIWTQVCQQSFDKLKLALTGAEVMGFPKDEGTFTLDTDASDMAIGAVLSQEQDGRSRVISYGSRTLNRAEKNYCVTDKELLAVRYFTEYYRQYLLGRKFIVRTDHQALKWLFSLKEPKGRVARWLEILSPFDFEVEYRPGPKHGNSDSMSRCNNPRDCNCPDQDNLEYLKCGPCKKCHKRALDMMSTMNAQINPLDIYDPEKLSPCNIGQEINKKCTVENPKIDQIDPNITEKVGTVCAVKTRQQVFEENTWTPWNGGFSRKELENLQRNDPDIGPIYVWKENDNKPCFNELSSRSPATRHYWHQWDSIEIKDGLLFRTFCTKDGIGNYTQFIVPFNLKNTVLHNMHDSVLSGHLGKKKTKGKLSQKYYWYEMREDLNVWISQCQKCGEVKPPVKTHKAPLGSMPVGAPLDRIATDLLGPLPLTPRGNRYILTVTDYFTKWVEVFPVPDQTAVTCAQIILNEVICRLGCPLSIHSDQGRNYESQIFQELCKLLEIRKTRTSPKNPKCNGQTERFNRNLISMIKSYLRGEQENWDLNLGCLAGAYRASPHESTGLTPNILMLGREIRLPFEITSEGLDPRSSDLSITWGAHAQKIKERLHRAHQVARKHLEINMKRRKDYYDTRANLILYKENDRVWYLNENRKEGVCQKLQPLYLGPCVVTKKLSDLNYEIQLDRNGTRKVVNHDKLKPYLGKEAPKWVKNLIKS